MACFRQPTTCRSKVYHHSMCRSSYHVMSVSKASYQLSESIQEALCTQRDNFNSVLQSIQEALCTRYDNFYNITDSIWGLCVGDVTISITFQTKVGRFFVRDVTVSVSPRVVYYLSCLV
jgi:hypothetical protein